MKALIQRVTQARVLVDGTVAGEIERGILLFLGVEKGDGKPDVERLCQRVTAYRIFPDDISDHEVHMNRSLTDINGDLLIVSQFTLVANTNKGLKPSFSSAAEPDLAKQLYTRFIEEAVNCCSRVETGVFGADMQVELVNDGPVTFMLSS